MHSFVLGCFGVFNLCSVPFAAEEREQLSDSIVDADLTMKLSYALVVSEHDTITVLKREEIC